MKQQAAEVKAADLLQHRRLLQQISQMLLHSGYDSVRVGVWSLPVICIMLTIIAYEKMVLTYGVVKAMHILFRSIRIMSKSDV